jgi:hypothetical protein
MATYYWVGGNGTWNTSTTTNWAASSGGAGGAGVPNLNDTAIIDANSGSGTITTATGAICIVLTFNAANITLTLGADLTVRDTCTFTAGTINIGSHTLTVQFFSSSNTNVRTINFGGGKIAVTGILSSVWATNPITNMVVTGTPNVELTGAATVSRTINAGDPTEAQSFNFSIKAGTDTLTIFSQVKSLDFTGFSGTWAGGGLNVYGGLVLSSGMTIQASASNLSFLGTAGPYSITCAGKTIDQPVRFAGVGGSWQFTDTFNHAAARTLTLTAGTLNGNAQNVNIGSFALGAGTKTLTLGSGAWTVAASGTAWNANTNVANLTVSASTGTINMTSSSTKTFAGGGNSWPTLNQGGSGALTIQQSNTFTNITDTVQPATITLTAGTTQTVSAFGVAGASGNLITLNSSSAGSPATLSDSSGTNSVSFVSIKDISATGGATWAAYSDTGNIDAGGNTGWDFGLSPAYDIEFSPALRSFTERKHF